MAICVKCGAEVDNDAKFCGICGNKMPINIPKDNTQRRTVYDGEIHKCPSCGATLESFVKNCPECGYELRGSAKTESVNEFSIKYAKADLNSKKIDLIRTYAIPNTKEDILEFVILASSNIDEDSIINGDSSQQELSDAWMAKFEQAYQKALLLLEGTPELKKIEKLHNEIVSKINQNKKVIERESIREHRKLNFMWFLLFLILAGIPIGLECYSHYDEQNVKRQIEQVEAYISVGDYDKALTEAYAMHSSFDSLNCDETRENFIARIEKLRGENIGLARIPMLDYEHEQYSTIVSAFVNAGFTNVKTEGLNDLNDLVGGLLHNEGEVQDVEINGQTDYEKGTYVSPDVPIIIRYHNSSD